MRVCIYIRRTWLLKKCSQDRRLVCANGDGREGEWHFSKRARRNRRNSHPQNTRLEKPPMQVENISHMLGSQTLGLSTLDTASPQVLDGCSQPPARCMGTGMEQPSTPGFQLLPSAMLLSRLCPAHHCPQGTDLGVPHLQRVSLWFNPLSGLTQQ